MHGGAQAGGVGAEGTGAVNAPRARSTAATLADLQVLWGGRDRLLKVAEVAERLSVGAWRLYQLCEDGELPHVHINNSTRIRPQDLGELIAPKLIIAGTAARTGEEDPPSRHARVRSAFSCVLQGFSVLAMSSNANEVDSSRNALVCC